MLTPARPLWLWSGAALVISQLALMAAAAWRLTVFYNHGIGFGLLSAVGALPLVLDLAGLGVLLLAVWSLPSGRIWPEALALGGAIGNLLDRLVLGGVPDPFRLPPYPFSFNLADVMIRIGLLAWLICLLAARYRRRHSAQRP